MPDREKVVKWLETCIIGCDDSCPYKRECESKGGFIAPMTDALALLKAQEARVIKVAKYDDEIKSPEMDCFTWIEERGREDVYIGTVNRTSHMNYGEEIYCFIRFWGNSKDGIKFEDYNKTWRCWTSHPDEKRRAETPWE